MSFLRKIINSDKLLIKNGFLSVGRYYSRRSNSKCSAFLRQIDERDDIEDNSNNYSNIYDDEGGPWELLVQKGNRFYLPGSLGPTWQSDGSIIKGVDVDNLIDFSNSKESNKLHIHVKQCPMLVRKDVRKSFTGSRLSKDITMITLYYTKHTEVDQSAKNFVLAARALCLKLMGDKFWADFINPFSGKPFFGGNDHDPFKPFVESQQKLFTVDKHFCGLGIKLENRNHCLVISSDVDGMFSGNVFTNAKMEVDVLELTCTDEPASVKSLEN